MRRKVLFAAVTVMTVLWLAYTVTAQDRKPPRRTGSKEDPRIMPEFAPPEDEGKGVTTRFFVDITTHNIKDTSAGRTFIVKGKSEFPDGTEATVRVKFYEEALARIDVPVRNGLFETVFEAAKEWPGKKLFPGHYELEAEIHYHRQSRSIKKKILEELGETGKTRAYRNKYATLGSEKARKKEENKLKDYYIKAITETQKLFEELNEKFSSAGEKFTRLFFLRDEKNQRIPNPKNKHTFLVDEKKWREHLGENPNEFYSKSGKFKEGAWRKWLDGDWRRRWEKLYGEHNRLLGNYVALPWPRQYSQMTTLLKMIMAKSSKNSEEIYALNGLPLHKKDIHIERDPSGGRLNVSNRKIMNLVKSLKNKLGLVRRIRERKAEEEKKSKGRGRGRSRTRRRNK